MSLKKIIKTLNGCLLLCATLSISPFVHAEDGVSSTTIFIGGVMDLEGRSKGLGLKMKAGIEAAFKDEVVQKRHIQYITRNDSYNPKKTIKTTNKLIKEGVFIFAGNVGTPTAKVSLPLLKKHKIPAVGFFTGAGLLRPKKSYVLNYRASYIQETAKVIKVALKKGIKGNQICAYVQNDAYGMAGIEGIIRALKGVSGSEMALLALEEIKSSPLADYSLNNKGPVGSYKRNSDFARRGYKSLKAWEQSQNTQCKLVVTVGSYKAITEFIAYSRYKKEPWIFTAVSFTGADNLKNTLQEFRIKDGVIMTQVVPLLDSKIALVKEAKKKLNSNFSYVSLEGFIVGKLILHGLKKIEGNITRKHFTNAILNSRFKLGELALNFTDDHQGSDLVELVFLEQGEWTKRSKRNIWNN